MECGECIVDEPGNDGDNDICRYAEYLHLMRFSHLHVDKGD